MKCQYSYLFVALLMLVGCQSEASGQPKIHRLYESGDKQALMEYVRNNPDDIDDVSESGDTVVMLAAYDQKKEMLEFLVDSGADVDIANQVGTTPLAAACIQSNEEMVRYLLAHNPDPNAGGGAALQWAVAVNNITICRMLLDAGADPLLENGVGENAIEKARRKEFKDIAELLESHIRQNI